MGLIFATEGTEKKRGMDSLSGSSWGGEFVVRRTVCSTPAGSVGFEWFRHPGFRFAGPGAAIA